MAKCKIIAEPVQHLGRDYRNGEILSASEAVITSLVSIGVAVLVEDVAPQESTVLSQTQREIPPSVTPTTHTPRRRRQQVETETEEEVEA
jgi:hypothetical protein